MSLNLREQFAFAVAFYVLGDERHRHMASSCFLDALSEDIEAAVKRVDDEYEGWTDSGMLTHLAEEYANWQMDSSRGTPKPEWLSDES